MGIFIDDFHALFFVLTFAYKPVMFLPRFDQYTFGSIGLGGFLMFALK